MYSTPRQIVKKANGYVLRAAGNRIGAKRLKPTIDRCHRQLHRALHPNRYPRSFLKDVLKWPDEILRCSGTMVDNVTLLMAFKWKRPIEWSTEGYTPEQKVISNILSFKAKEWNELLEHDPVTFMELQQHLATDIPDRVYIDPVIVSIARRMAVSPGNLAEHIQLSTACEYNEDEEELERCIRIHNEFCEPIVLESELNNLIREYREMLAQAETGVIGTRLYPERLFYDEIRLYNELIITRGSPEFFEKALLRKEYITENERYVYSYVKRMCKNNLGK